MVQTIFDASGPLASMIGSNPINNAFNRASSVFSTATATNHIFNTRNVSSTATTTLVDDSADLASA